MSQRQLALLLGNVTASQVSRHERSVSPPSLPIAFAYQVAFREPVSDLFPGLYHAIESGVEERLVLLENELGSSSAKGRAAMPVARQLEWLCQRNNPETP